jgi:lysyl-tRNA synthetase class 2
MLQKRASIIKNIRSFFYNKGYLELDTPLLCSDLIPESCLEVFQTERLFPAGSRKQSQSLWLIPSPEIWMKKIITQHRVSVFQICKCFRNGESEGHLHSSEFTMLEYYTMNADYMDSLALTEELFEFLYQESNESNNEKKEDKKHVKSIVPFERITVSQAFTRYAGFDLFTAAAEGSNAMTIQARKLGLDPMPNMTVPQLYDLIFIHSVEPHLKSEKPVALIDYPAFVPCLAKKPANNQTAERWELYFNGIELANCFTEENDPEKVKDFFINEETEKNRSSLVQHKVDHNYWKMFEKEGFPSCSGVAMGIDRLIMALTGKASIGSVLPFSSFFS